MKQNGVIRVLHVLDSLAPGGLENGVVNVAGRLHGDGFEVHAGCLRFRGEFAERMPDPSKVSVLGKGSGFSLKALFRLRRLIAESGADVVHTHNLGTLIYAALATFWGRSVPIVHGEHGQLQPPDLTPKRLAQRRRFFGSCRTIHVVSASLKDSLGKLGLDPGGRILVTTNGVDCDRFKPAVSKAEAKEKAGLEAGDLVVGIVGRLVKLKRHAMLFDAIARVGEALPNVKLLVVGDGGADRDELVGLMQSHPAADRIRWVGHQNELLPWYQAMDLMAAPSEIEGLSNAVLEAMASGLPVLAHVACGNAEVIRHRENGFLSDIVDAASLAASLAEVLGDAELLIRCGERARETVKMGYSMESMEKAYRDMYHGAVRR